MATRAILGELAARYEASRGIEVEITAMGGVDAAQAVRDACPTDVVILASGPMARLEAEGRLLSGSVRPICRSGMAIAVRAGGERPDIGDEEAVKRAVMAASTVGYSTGPSGDHLLQLCQRWGAAIDSGRFVKAPAGVPVAVLLAQGLVEIGFQQLSELIDAPGVEVVGPLPPEIQSVTVFAAGIASASKQPEATGALIDYLASAATAGVKRARGMDPA
jgi:molybdate transport system substrate-binding protein